jgi:hypothetical protein
MFRPISMRDIHIHRYIFAQISADADAASDAASFGRLTLDFDSHSG